jgi:hypothetical protein
MVPKEAPSTSNLPSVRVGISQRSFPEGYHCRDRTPLDLAVRLDMVKWPRLDQEPGVNVDAGTVRFLRDGACKR